MPDQAIKVLAVVSVLLLATPSVSAVTFIAITDSEVPEALRKAQAQRSPEALRTARIDYSLEWRTGEPNESPHSRFFSWRCAGPDLMNVNYGREDGVIHESQDGSPSTATFLGHISALAQDGQIWAHTEDCPEVGVWPTFRAGRFALLDLRKIGFYPANLYDDLEMARERLGPDGGQYSQRSEGGLEIVTFEIKERGGFVWWIDPAKDWAVVRNATFDAEGKQIGETRFEYEVFDGYWFPRHIENLDTSGGQASPFLVIDTIAAEFNRPEHPPMLTKADIGTEVGTAIMYEESDRPMAIWDGAKPVSRAEYRARVEQGELTPGPNRQRVLRQLQARAEREARLREITATTQATSKPAPRESEWERFTREFIKIYELGDEQSQKAHLICRECQNLAREILDSRRSEIESVEGELSAMSAPGGTVNPAKRQELQRKLDRLTAPVQAIFESNLRPRFFKLPTKAQLEKGRQKPMAAGPLAPERTRR